MTLYTEKDAKAILEKVIQLSKADECSAALQGSVTGNIRFARNAVSTSGSVDDCDLTVQVAFGRRTGVATINAFDDASLENVVRRAEELARLAPENPEFVPAVAKQRYKPSQTFVQATADITPAERTQVAANSIKPCKAANLVAAGFLSDAHGFSAIANSNGNFGYQKTTILDYTCTVRTADGAGSGWVARNVADVRQFDASSQIQVAMRKARDSASAKALEPGKYTVIMEPAATAGLLSFMMFGFDARRADEGRSFLSKKGGGNRVGEQMFDPRVTIYADHTEPGAEVLPWDEDGRPRERTSIVEQGKIRYLDYSRYWAKKQNVNAPGSVGNLIMVGGDASTMDLVKKTRKGILVTRTWYIRMVDPQTMLLTGLTRDGTFYVENGEIRHPVKNFRFNESPAIMLNNIEQIGRPERVGDDESPFVMMIPPMVIRDFTFTSLSDAV